MLYLTVSGISCPADGHSGMKLCNEMCKNVIFRTMTCVI